MRAAKGRARVGITVNTIARNVGVLTASPVMALVTVSLMYLHDAALFGGGAGWRWVALVFLTALPISAYILKSIIPSIRVQGRRGERKLAFIMSVVSYVVGTLFCLVRKAPRAVSRLFLSYMASGALLAFVNAALKFRASGHACGFAGPLTYLARFVGPMLVLVCAAFVLPIVYWARLRAGRHSLRELVSGTIIGFAATQLVGLVYV